MTRLMVTLPSEIADALTRSALAELRPARLQAAALIREALERRGHLPMGQQVTPPTTRIPDRG